MPKKRILRKFKLNEISMVDRPAQRGATALIMKRAMAKDDGAVIVITSADSGHAHALWIRSASKGGITEHARDPEDDQSHSHPWVWDGEGRIIVGQDSGHDHIVDADEVARAFVAMGAERLRAVVGAELAEMFKRRVSNGTTKGDDTMSNDFQKAVGQFDEALETIAKSKMVAGDSMEQCYDRLLRTDASFQNLLKVRQVSQDLAVGGQSHEMSPLTKAAKATIAKTDGELDTLAKAYHAKRPELTYEQAYDEMIQQPEPYIIRFFNKFIY